MSIILEVLVILVFVFTVGIMGMWQFLSRGTWRNYATGKALMGLLTAHALIFGLVTVGIFIPKPVGAIAWVVLCVGLLIAKARVAWVIWSLRKVPEDTT